MAMIAGFMLASRDIFDIGLFLATLLGLALIIASACVFNNCIDREIDEKMGRTKKRPLVTNAITIKNALIYATVLGLLGTYLLYAYTTMLALGFALLGLFFYVVVYGIAKRRTVYGTHIGTIPGAVPPVVGYCAVTNSFDMGALLLFLILVFWQMPHFLALAVLKSNEYKLASIPVMPLSQGLLTTKVNIVAFAVLFVIASVLLTLLGYTGYVYLVVIALLGIYWLWIGVQGFAVKDINKWAGSMFKVSIIILIVFSFLVSFDRILL